MSLFIDTVVPTRQCSICNLYKPLKSYNSKYHTFCTLCKNNKKRDKAARAREANKGKELREKKCSFCRETRDILWFKKESKDRYSHDDYGTKCSLCAYKNSSKRKGRVWGLTDCFAMEIMLFGQCIYCGDSYDRLGIDRMDSSIGYVPDNVAPCCWKCNDMKGTLTMEQFMNQVSKIYMCDWTKDIQEN